MDAKDLRTQSALSERNNDGSKYSQSGGIALHCDRNKSYQNIGSNSLGKVEVPTARPCAIIGPDRVVPPPAASEAYHSKKGPAEPWPCLDSAYRRPPDYPHKLTSFQNPTRNISPRQTFQENMQRIMVPPTYNSIKINDDTNYAQMSDRSNGLSKNNKLNMPPEAKFCDVPYSVNPTNNEPKNTRNPEMCLPSVNPTLTRTAPLGWSPGSVNLRTTRMYGAPELYQYQEYPSCAGPRPVVPRPHRTVPEEQGYMYADPYYQDGNIRFKPYPSVKERYPQQRYEYIGNYSNPFHPPPAFPPLKYELQKAIPPHPYPSYPPIKYLDSRLTEPVMEGYQRNPQGNYNIQYRNQVIHPNYGPVIGNSPQNKMHSYPPDAHMKSIPPIKVPYDNNTKAYVEYDNNRPKIYPASESYFVNEMARIPMKSQVIMPNYPTLNMVNIPPNPYYKKDSQQMKNYEHIVHFRNMDPNLNVHNSMSRHAPAFSPSTLAISPTDSNTSNDTTQTLATSQEDCGYVSQSSTTSARSMDSAINRIPNEYYRKYYDNRYGPPVRTSPMISKSQLNSNNNVSKDNKQINVRQFLQMWNEGDEEQEENSSKEIIIQTGSSDKNNFGKTHEAMNSQEQLYVLGLVNVPSEELAKYEHIQKVSKLPENIKGYNSIELLNQFEEVIESSNMNNYKTPTPKEFHMSMKGVHQKQTTGMIIPQRPVSPLDVESKISQSVIHKEVGCNFEIKPCSPKMLNVEVAAPIRNILAERSIEKVANPVMLKSPMLNGMNESIDCNIMKRTDHRMNINENVRIPSCKMINTQFSNSNTIDTIKSSYSLQDLESNSGLCLASLPRLDNDIELNFPEVNQQFINANKGDNAVLINSRDLSPLEALDQSDNQIKDNFSNMSSSRSNYDVDKSPNIDVEKEFSKLSKYRKTKTYSSEPKESQIQHNVNAIRTDSVIIKNPDNMRNYEDYSDFSSNSLSKMLPDIQQAPINLTSQGNFSSNMGSAPDNIDLHKVEKAEQLPVEIAIDFSLNKTGILNSTESTETKMESQMRTPIQIEENPLNTLINKDDSSDSTSLLPVFTERNENLINMDNIDGNCSLHGDGDKEGKENVNNMDNINENCSLHRDGDSEGKENLINMDNIDGSCSLHQDEESVGKEHFINMDNIDENCSSHRDSEDKENLNNMGNIDGICSLHQDGDSQGKQNLIDMDNIDGNCSLHREKDSEDKLNLINMDNIDGNCRLREIGSDDEQNLINMDNIDGNCGLNLEKGSQSTQNLVNMDNIDVNCGLNLGKDSEGKQNLINIDENCSLYRDGDSEGKQILINMDNKDGNCSLHREKDSEDKLNLINMDNTDGNCSLHQEKDSEDKQNVINMDHIVGNCGLNLKKGSEGEHNLINMDNTDGNCSLHQEKGSEGKHNLINMDNIDENCSLHRDGNSEGKQNLIDMDNIDGNCSLHREKDSEDKLNLNMNNMDNTDGNRSLHREKDSEDKQNLTNIDSSFRDEKDSEGIPITDIDKNADNTDFKETPSSNESYKKTDCEINTCASNNNAEEIIIDVSSTLSATKFEIPVNEILSNFNNDNYEKEIYNCDDTTDESSEEANYTFSDNSTVISQNSTKNLDEKYKMDIGVNTINVVRGKDFSESHNVVNKINSPEHTELKLDIGTTEVTNLSEINVSVVTEETKLQNINSENLLLTNDETYCTDCECSDVIQSQNLNSESRPLSKDYVVDHLNDKIEVDSTPQLLEEFSDHERKLNDFEEKYCEDTQNSPTELKADQRGPDKYVNKDQENQECEMPIRKKLWYGSKESYSPWIQKLLMFSEGNCNNVTSKNYIDSNIDYCVDSTQSANITVENEMDHDDSHCDLNTSKIHLLEKDCYTNITEDLKQDNLNEIVEETINTSILSSSLDHNIDEIVNSDDHSECEDISTVEAMHNEENEPTMDEVDDILAPSKPVVASELNDSNISDPSLESELDSTENTNINFETQLNSDIEAECEVPDTSNVEDAFCESFQEAPEHCDEPPQDKNAALESPAFFENVRFSCNGIQTNQVSYKKYQRLKRSLSDSALNMCNNDDERPKQKNEKNVQIIWPFKRRKVDNDLLAQNLCNIIHHNRRNSVSSFYNEDNVSFCILIDNSCIITEEENEEPEKECYTELSEDYLAEIQNNCMKHDDYVETLSEVVSSPKQENACDYSASLVLDCEEEKILEESWVEDVGCVETVISDDIGDDIEICEPCSPKNGILSDNDESGVFSSSEHTDKVKFIYGDKMCNDDALFVETLYKTPQMDVNKTLYNRETRVSEESNRYYDNESLEKMLSESNEPVSPYIPRYMDSMFPSRKVDVNKTPENKENMNIETFPPFQSKGNALDIVLDINVDKIERENMHSIEIFKNTQEDTVHSCESSVDNVFTYNQKDEDTIYTSSSPEVSSTTSEEKNSGILLKITNYKGSRISQINDISRVNKRSSCKFTEDKKYLHSHANFSLNRPLLTKAAQKYIPPLKESIRDLKVKLSLPQHSLMKLKQLKISKDAPKVNKPNATKQRIPKKPKPKFEDVLKSIDEIQFKKHKENTKKTKKNIPKVVIKKNLNGSHYASTSNKDDFNPDMTGRKWQPWVFIEKNLFIDKMATKNKTKAVYSHRKRTYVLAEKFQKYKSASSAKFVISPPISDNPSSGLKYTIRLKHNY